MAFFSPLDSDLPLESLRILQSFNPTEESIHLTDKGPKRNSKVTIDGKKWKALLSHGNIDECSVCLTDIGVKSLCGQFTHSFCEKDFQDLMRNNTKKGCPVCSRPLADYQTRHRADTEIKKDLEFLRLTCRDCHKSVRYHNRKAHIEACRTTTNLVNIAEETELSGKVDTTPEITEESRFTQLLEDLGISDDQKTLLRDPQYLQEQIDHQWALKMDKADPGKSIEINGINVLEPCALDSDAQKLGYVFTGNNESQHDSEWSCRSGSGEPPMSVKPNAPPYRPLNSHQENQMGSLAVATNEEIALVTALQEQHDELNKLSAPSAPPPVDPMGSLAHVSLETQEQLKAAQQKFEYIQAEKDKKEAEEKAKISEAQAMDFSRFNKKVETRIKITGNKKKQ